VVTPEKPYPQAIISRLTSDDIQMDPCPDTLVILPVLVGDDLKVGYVIHFNWISYCFASDFVNQYLPTKMKSSLPIQLNMYN
jgi:hypothetical protein